MKRLLAVLHLLFGLLMAQSALAADLTLSRGLLVDPQGSLTIRDVVHGHFRSIPATLSEGYTDAVHWLRIRVKAPDDGEEVSLQVRSAFLDDVQLFEAADTDRLEWITRVAGDQHTYDPRAYLPLTLGFTVRVDQPEKTYYLRVQTSSATQFRILALGTHEAVKSEVRDNLLTNIFMGLMLWALIWAIDHFMVDRRGPLGWFALYQGVVILYGLAAAGVLMPLIPAQWHTLGDWVSNLLNCAVPFSLLLFARSFFRMYRADETLLRGGTWLLLAFPLLVGLMALGHARLALNLTAVLSLALSWYYVALAFSTQREQVPSRKTVRAVTVVLALLATETLASRLGWFNLVEASASSEWILVFTGLGRTAPICALLYMHLRQSRRDAQQAAVALALSNQALQLERQHKEKAETHARTDYLTGVFNRRHFVERVERILTRAQRQREPFSLLMMDIDHFKQVNDTWGHRGGDLVLKHVAGQVRDMLREVDVFGRVGGEEFAAVLVGTPLDEAQDVAERLRVAIGATLIPLTGGGNVRITLSIGVAEFSGQDLTLDGLLHKADEALYQAKRAGRNAVVTAA